MLELLEILLLRYGFKKNKENFLEFDKLYKNKLYKLLVINDNSIKIDEYDIFEDINDIKNFNIVKYILVDVSNFIETGNLKYTKKFLDKKFKKLIRLEKIKNIIN